MACGLQDKVFSFPFTQPQQWRTSLQQRSDNTEWGRHNQDRKGLYKITSPRECQKSTLKLRPCYDSLKLEQILLDLL